MYQSGHAIWYGGAPNVENTFVKGYDLSGKKITLFSTSEGSGIGKSAEELKEWIDSLYDNFSPEDIKKVAGSNTILIAPEKMQGKVNEVAGLV